MAGQDLYVKVQEGTETQAKIDVLERNHSMNQILFFIWTTFFTNVQTVLKKLHEGFEIFEFAQYDSDHSRQARIQDTIAKIHAIHEMLQSSWIHPIPPPMAAINFPGSHITNEMLIEQGSEYGYQGIMPKYGFVEPPSLNPDVVPLSIDEYLAAECTYVNEDDHHILTDQKAIAFVKFAKDQSSTWYDPTVSDPTFLSDLMERYGSTTYPEICRMFPGLLSDYHPTD
jgi:hypothetical protein